MSNNYTPERWSDYLAKYKKDTQRVTPILAKQAKNNPHKK